MNSEEQLYHLPDGWQLVSLEEITLPIERVNREYQNQHGTFKYIDIESIDNEKLKLKTLKEFSWANAPSRAQQVVKTDDIIFATVRPYLKNIALIPALYDGGIASSGFCIIRPILINPKYIFYYVSTQSFVHAVNKLAKGTSYPAVTTKLVLEQKIPLPSIGEQQRIVSKVEELFSELDQASKTLLIAKDQLAIYKQAFFKKAFNGGLSKKWRKANKASVNKKLVRQHTKSNTEALSPIPKEWKWIFIDDISEHIASGSTPKGGSNVYAKEGIPFIRSQNVYPGILRTDDLVYISNEINDKMQRTQLKEKDVLLNITGASIGRCAYVPENFGKGNINQHVCIIRIGVEDVSYKYLCHYLNSPEAQIYIDKINSGATREALTLEQIKNFPFPVCSLEEQILIVQELEYHFTIIANLEETIHNNLNEIAIIRSAILKKAFEGKLVMPSSNDEPAIQSLERALQEKLKYLETQSMIYKETPKKRQVMKEKRSIIEVLEIVAKPMSANDVWQQSIFNTDIDAFYSALKDHIEMNEIIELPRKGKNSFLTLTNSK